MGEGLSEHPPWPREAEWVARRPRDEDSTIGDFRFKLFRDRGVSTGPTGYLGSYSKYVIAIFFFLYSSRGT